MASNLPVTMGTFGLSGFGSHKEDRETLEANVAEICFAAGGLAASTKDARKMGWADRDSREMMDALRAAAYSLTKYELEQKRMRTDLWESHDWYIACDNIAEAVMKGGELLSDAQVIRIVLES